MDIDLTPSCTNSRNGFTLVEIIVVSVLVVTLAAAAVPLYIGYVNRSRSDASANTSATLASFCGACLQSGGMVTPTGTIAAGAQLNCSSGSSNVRTPSDMEITITLSGPGGVATVRHRSGGNSVSTRF